MNMRIQIAPPAPAPVQAPADYAAKVAAEIAARYGCAVTPEAVRIAPRGATGQLRVHPHEGRLVLVMPDGSLFDKEERRRQARITGQRNIDRRFGSKPETAARRREIQALHDQGLTPTEMVALGRGWTDNMVRDDHRALGLMPINRIARTHEQILAMAREGGSSRGIAAALNISRDTVRSVCRSAGVVLAADPAANPGGRPRKVREVTIDPARQIEAQRKADERRAREAKRATILDMARAGKSAAQIAGDVGGVGNGKNVLRLLWRAVKAGELDRAVVEQVAEAGRLAAFANQRNVATRAESKYAEAVRLYVEEKMPIGQIAKMMGARRVQTVRDALRRAGVFIPRSAAQMGRIRPESEAARVMTERRAWIRAELEAGRVHRRVDLARRFGVVGHVIGADLDAIDRECPGLVRIDGMSRREAEWRRRLDVLAPYVGRGLSTVQIERETGISCASVARVLRHLEAMQKGGA